MQLEINARHFTMGDEQREVIEAAVEKLVKFAPRPVESMKMTITHEAGRFFADSVLHIWKCKANDGKTVADVTAESVAWLEAARTVDGGDDLSVYLEWPIAANMGDGGFNFVMSVADEQTWGTWYGSESASDVMGAANIAWSEVATCSKSSLWYSNELE